MIFVFDRCLDILGERVDTSIFCSSSIKSNRPSSEPTQPHICVTPYVEQIKDIQSENQAIDNVRLNIRKNTFDSFVSSF